jgi:hypothetical protein
LEHVLGDIQTNRGNLHVDGSLYVIRQQRSPDGIRCRRRASSTASEAASRATKKIKDFSGDHLIAAGAACWVEAKFVGVTAREWSLTHGGLCYWVD